jgi:hypothetical protein
VGGAIEREAAGADRPSAAVGGAAAVIHSRQVSSASIQSERTPMKAL